MLTALLGRKAISMSTLGRATTAARGVSRSMTESQDIARANERVRDAHAQLASLEGELEAEVSALSATSAAPIPIETVEVKPKRGAIEVRLVSLAWGPQA